jgi:prepilin-type N-terminal cleavage/methylation domain-containing protein
MKIINKHGFTLVELSLVIIIIGFLIAGISAGHSLIKQAVITAVIDEKTQYINAAYTFRTTFGYLPGDFPNAFAYWGLNCAPDGSPGDCNGNGDGQIYYVFGPSQPNQHEGLHAWQHMALAGIIPGSYTGIAVDVDNGAEGGVDAPFSKYAPGIWVFTNTNNTYANPLYTDLTRQGNLLLLGQRSYNNMPLVPLLTPSDAQNIDTKIDDGIPRSGYVFSDNACPSNDWT